MNSIRRSLVGLSLLGVILWAGASSPAQAASSNGPYYAEPAWDQKLPAATRFIVLTDWFSQAVLDRETGLVWEQATASEVRPWGEGPGNARLACADRAVGGRKGWRLPSIAELASLIDPTQTNPALPLGHPFTIVLAHFYWSATSAENPILAWFVDFSSGHLGGDFYKSSGFHVWCVRSSMQESVY